MKKKLDTRFPAARIKKIMQADDEIGKIALATPVLISKALELFLQDLVNKTYEITTSRGAKTLNGLNLKKCVSMYNQFDFLKEIVVSRVPDSQGCDDAGESSAKSRGSSKMPHKEDIDSEEEAPKPKKRQKTDKAPSRGRGRRNSSASKPSKIDVHDEDDDVDTCKVEVDEEEKEEPSNLPKVSSEDDRRLEVSLSSVKAKSEPRDFDLNEDLNEADFVADNGVSHSVKIETDPLKCQGISRIVAAVTTQSVLHDEEDYDDDE